MFVRPARCMTALAAATGLVVLALPAGGASAAAGSGPTPGIERSVGKPYALPKDQPRRGPLGSFSSSAQTPLQHQEAAAEAEAAKLGRPVAVASLTTEQEMVTASPDGMLTMTSYPLPVRVQQDGKWVPVSTDLRASGGMLAAPALPGDTIQFSAGGTGPMAEIGAGASSLALWWPSPLPAPVVSGPSATYQNVLPGVNLVLTAENGPTGSLSEALVVSSAQAAQEVKSVDLRVTSRGARLEAKDGGLVAPLTGGGEFVAPPATMWDSGTSGKDLAARAAAMGGRPQGVAPAGGATARSSIQGPGRYALTGKVAAQVADGGKELRLVPDAAMLDSSQTAFPVVIDPTLYLETNGGGSLQAYDPVQSGSGCTGSNYNSSIYYDSPVGYDNFQAGNCQDEDTDYALYRVGVSTALGATGVTIATATVEASVAYSSDCGVSAVVRLSWIGGIKSSTGWPGPDVMADNTDERATFPPDADSCNDTLVTDDGALVSESFNVKPDINKMKGASNFTFRLWEPAGIGDGNPTSEDYHVQFANGKHDSDGPYLQVQFFDQPATVSTSTMEESTSSNDSNPYACATSTSAAPAVVPTSAGGGVYTGAVYSDPDGHTQLGGTVRYFLASDPSAYQTTATAASAVPSSSGSYSEAWDTAPIPWSWLSTQTDGAIVGWQTEAYTGTDTVSGTTYGPFYSAAFSGTCYFADYWDVPEQPDLTATVNTDTSPASVTITISQSPNDANPPSEYVYALDNEPPVAGSIPDSQLCTTDEATTPDCVINSSGDATLTFDAPAPGPHTVSAYEIDSEGQTTGDGQVQFTAPADTPPQPFTSGSSLQANFATALSSGYADNTIISNSSGSPCSANGGDGEGEYFDAAQLAAAGWAPNGQITIDGASFTLPDYGSCAADNVLAANQTIGAGSGVSGSELVFLATSTVGDVAVPGQMTGDPNTDTSLVSDVTAPAVMGGEPVTGSGCVEAPEFATQGCVPATGTVTYASGCPAGVTRQSYYLTAPDWVEGPDDIQAISIPDRVNSDGEQADSPKIYAFAVPLYQDCTVLSVTLPDIGPSVYVTTAGGLQIPALHIFGISVSNTTTATPEADGTQAALPSGQSWTGAVESPVQDAYAPPSGQTWGDQTFREDVVPDASQAESGQVRIQLSDPGFLAADGDGPLQIGAVTIAEGILGAIPAGPPMPLTFGGSTSVTIPEGGTVYSDPLTLQVTAGWPLLVSVYIENSSLPVLPGNLWPSAGLMWWSASGTGDETGDQTGTPFTGTSAGVGGVTGVLTAVDVTTAGDPTVVVAGDNIIDGAGSDALSDSLNVPSDRLAGQLYSQGLTTGYGVVDAGIEANQVLTSDTANGGVSLVARFAQDVLAEPDVGTVIIDEGLQDLLSSAPSETTMDTAYAVLTNILNAAGINVIIATMTPCDGYADDGHSCTASVTDPTRYDVDSDILGADIGTGVPYCPAETDSTVSNGGSPEALATSPTDYDSGDHANLSFAGYAAMADAFNPADTQYGPCSFGPNNDPPSS